QRSSRPKPSAARRSGGTFLDGASTRKVPRLRRPVGGFPRDDGYGIAMTTVDTAARTEAEDRVPVASNWTLVWWRFRRHHLAMASAVLLILMYLVVIAPDFFSTQDPERSDARQVFIPVQMVHLLDDGQLAPWVPAIVGKRNPTTLRMEWATDPQKK